MRRKPLDVYFPGGFGQLRNTLAKLYFNLDRMSTNLYLVGGLVPEFLVINKIAYLKEYLGTLDIDIAVELAVEKKADFNDFYPKLRSLGFEKQKTEDGLDLMSHSFIKHAPGNKKIILDLIVDDNFEPKADKLLEIAPNVEAAKFRGVYLVFSDYLEKSIKMTNDTNIITIKIPNIVPFLTLKAFAYMDQDNGTAKDAFDIWYTIVNYEEGPDTVNKEIFKYKTNADAQDAFRTIKESFNNESSRGTRDVVDILVRRYGLDRPRAIREVVSPLKLIEKYR